MTQKTRNENAVSPVIGTILMVAITITLAGVIAMFVFGVTGNISKTNIVAVNVNQLIQDKITVTYLGGQDTSRFSHATILITDDDDDPVKAKDNLTNIVGNSVTTEGDFSNSNHVIVVGYFTDGSAQVLADTYV